MNGTKGSGKGLRELDELAHIVFHLLVHQFEQLSSKYSSTAFSAVELAIALQPYLLCDPVPLHDVLRTPERCNECVRRLVDEATSAKSRCAARIYWEPFVEYLSAASRRHTLREGLRSKSTYRFSGQAIDCQPNIRQYAAVPPLVAGRPDGGAVVIRDDSSRRVAEWVDSQWAPIPAMCAQLQSAISGMATSVAYVPAPFHKAVISFTSSLGASLGFFDRNAEGKLALEVSTMTHQTVMKFIPTMGKILCGSALGELSTFTPSGRIGPTVVQPHNGPVVFLAHLSIADAFISAGSEGRLALVDAGTMTEVRRVDAVDGHISCASLCPELNVVAVAGSDTFPVLWNASLPPYAKGTPLVDGKRSHRHSIVDMSIIDDMLISLDASGLCKVWDIRTQRCVETHQPSLPDAQRRTATFSRLFRSPHDGSEGEGLIVAGSVGGLIFECSKTSSVDSYVPVADVSPVEHLCVLNGKTIVTASESSIRLWNVRTGELDASHEVREGCSPSSLHAIDESSLVLIGYTSGHVDALDANRLLSEDVAPLWEVTAIAGPVTGLVVVAQALIIGSPGATYASVIQPLKPSLASQIHGMDGFCSYEVLPSTGNVAIMSASCRLYVVEPTEDGCGVEDFREYDLNVSLRSELADRSSSAVPFCFFGSPSAVCVGDGADISVISLVGSRTRRVMSFPSVGGRCVCCAFETSNSKSVLMIAEDDGTCAVYLVTDLLPVVYSHLSKGFLGDHYAPAIHCSFVCPGARWCSLVKSLSICVFSFDSCKCSLYRVDGVRVGDLDMNGATGTSWLSILAKARRGSHIVFRTNTEVNEESYGKRAPKRMVSFPTRPTARHLADPLQDVDAVRQASFSERVADLTKNVSSSKQVVVVRGENSSRTLEPMDPSCTRWTTDAPETKPARDNLKLLTEMRLFTQGLKPGRSPLPQGRTLPKLEGRGSPSRRGRLSPLIPLGAAFARNCSPSFEVGPSPVDVADPQ